MRRLQGVMVTALSVTALVGGAGVADAHDAAQRPAKQVRIQDDCDAETFNAALGEGSCVGDGGTTFDELIAELREEGRADAWAFAPRQFTIRHGTNLRVLNEGGEVHSFTGVRRFGPGCVPEVNEILGFPAGARVAECRSPDWLRTLRAPGEVIRVRHLPEGTHRFECLIHPWMRARVEVRGAD
jgi:plastocyanin